MSTPTGTISVQIPNADGSITNLTGTLANCVVTTTPAPVVVPPPPPPNPEPVIPTTAQTVNMLLNKAWSCKHDLGTPGDASGTYSYPKTASDGTANCAELVATNTAKGGALYHANVLADATAFNTFCTEICEMSPSWANVACLEKDLEQVQGPVNPGEKTAPYVDLATQLDGYTKVVDITQNQKWVGTKVPANPTTRKPNVWYTARIYVRNNGGGSVTYIGIYLSDTNMYYPLNITVQSQPSDQWGVKLLNQQYQIVGLSSGSVSTTVYIKTMNTHMWKS